MAISYHRHSLWLSQMIVPELQAEPYKDNIYSKGTVTPVHLHMMQLIVSH